MKKALLLFLCLALVLSMLAGCSSQGKQPEAVQAEASAQQSETPAESEAQPQQEAPAEELPADETEAESEPVYPLSDGSAHLSLWTAGFNSDVDVYFTNQLYYTTMEDLTGVSMDFTVVSMQASAEQFGLMAAGGDYTDLIASISSYYSGGLTRAIEDDVIVDLASMLDSCMPNYKTVLESDSVYMKAVSSDDGYIGQAANLIQPENPVTSGPVIRKDWLDELELDIPETYDEYHDVLTAFKDQKGADAALWIPFMGCIAGNYLSAGYGVASYNLYARNEEPYYQVDGIVFFGPAEDGYYNYLSTLNQWYSEGLIWQDFSTSNNPRMPETDLILNDRTGLAYFAAENFNSYESAYTNGTMELVGIQDAVQNKGDVNHLRGGDAIIDGAQGVAVSTACEDCELAARWLDYNYSEEGQILTNYGVEGVTFEYVDGKPVYTELISSNPDGLTVREAQNLYLFGKGNCFEDGSRNLQFYSDNAVAAAEVWSEFDNDYLYPVGLSMTTEESETYAKKYADISTCVTEMTLKFIMGDEKLDDQSFSDFVSTLDDLGIDECISIKQDMLDRYYSR